MVRGYLKVRLSSLLPTFLLILATVLIIGCQSKKESSKGPPPEPKAESKAVPITPVKEVAFVPNDTCSECHSNVFEEWTGSHHELAMQEATEKSVLGNFNNRSFTHFGVRSRFFKKDGNFFVNTDGPDGKMADFEIKYAFGVDPLQQYLIELDKGRIQALSIAWDTKKKRWFHLYPNEEISHDDPLHWTKRFQNWNSHCGECHTTNFVKGYDLESDSYNTTFIEINVSCQSCHGPGEAHIQWAHENKKSGESAPGNYGLVVDFSANDSRYQVDACARCHSRRYQVSAQFQHGRPLLDDFVPAIIREGLYHIDGQILEEVYVYGSFVQSKMYEKGVRCTDCHNPHTARLKAEGNALCVRCHQLDTDSRFKTLKPKPYDTAKHHFHQADSPGGECVNCHMPFKNYMVVDPRNDHSFRIPRPDLSMKLGTPNACNRCHQDQSPQWAANAIAQWHGEKERRTHFAEILAAGRAQEPDAEALLVKLARDKSQSVIVRATALELLQVYGMEGIAVMINALQDKDPWIRTTAVRGLDRLSPQERPEWVSGALSDPVRAVRIEAGRVMASIPKEQLTPRQQEAFDSAFSEFIETQVAQADTPSAHLNLGVVYANSGEAEKAIASYETAIRIAPDFLPVRFNLANLYNRLGQNDEAEEQLRQILKSAPDNGEVHYSMGLLAAEMGRLGEAEKYLSRAAVLLPTNARVRYNLSLVLQNLDRPAEAETWFFKALKINPNDPEVIQAVAILYMQQEQWDEALPFAEKLAEMFPEDPRSGELVEQIKRQMATEGES